MARPQPAPERAEPLSYGPGTGIWIGSRAMELLWLCAVLLALPGAWGDCQKPPRFSFAEPLMPLNESYPVGTRLMFRCRPGYTVARGKFPFITCLASSSWSENPDFCIGRSCGPPDIPNGNFDYKTDLQLGATITFTCDIGYRLIGKPSAQCVIDGNDVSWNNIPYCEIIPCLPPPVIQNGQLISEDRDFTFGMAVTYRCDEGFALVGDDTIHCTASEELQGVWGGTVPVCKVVRCDNPEVKNGIRLSGFGTAHTYKDTVSFKCQPGHTMKGSNVVTCEEDSNWEPPVPTCEPNCGPAPQFPFAEAEGAVGDSSPAGTELSYHCKPGYTAASEKSSVVQCQDDGTWAAEPDFCTRQQCAPPTIENGAVAADNFLFGTVVTFSCHPGYKLKKSSSAKCVVAGNGVDWDPAPPYCERQPPEVLCGEPPRIDNGMHNGTNGKSFVQGSVVVYKCKDGFTLAGAAFLQCVAGDQRWGVWNQPAPQCRGGADVILVGIFPLLLALLVMNI